MKRFIIEISIAAIALTLFVYGLSTIDVTGQKSCEANAQINQSYQFHWDEQLGCLVKTNDGYWINTDKIQFINGKLQVELLNR